MKSKSLFVIDKLGRIVTSKKVIRNLDKRRIDLSMISIGYYLVTPLIIGVFLGLAIGERFHAKEKGALIGIMVGLVGTIYNLIKIVKSNASD